MDRLPRLADMYLNPVFSDVTITVANVVLPCHKVVLINRGEYFRTLLLSRGDWTDKENVDLTASIRRVDIMKAILGFMYGKEIAYSLSDVPLYIMAGRYLLFQELVVDCYQYLARSLTADNCLRVWQIADEMDLLLLADTCKELAPYFFRYHLCHQLMEFDEERVEQYMRFGLMTRTPRQKVDRLLAEYRTKRSLSAVPASLALPWSPAARCDDRYYVQLESGTLYHPGTDNFYFWPHGHFEGPVLYLSGKNAIVALSNGKHCLVDPKSPRSTPCTYLPPISLVTSAYFFQRSFLYGVYQHTPCDLYFKRWSQTDERWTYPAELYHYPLGSLHLICALENKEQTRAFLVLCRELAGQHSLMVIEFSPVVLDVSFVLSVGQLDKSRTTGVLVEDRKILILSESSVYSYDIESEEWDRTVSTECSLFDGGATSCKSHIAVPARPLAEGGQATGHHIYHRGSYGMDTGIDLLFAQHPKFPAWASAVPIEQDAPVFFPPMKLVRLSAGIQDILRPVSKMANTSDRLVSEHTVKEMGFDELLLLHPPVTAGERARRVRVYLAPLGCF